MSGKGHYSDELLLSLCQRIDSGENAYKVLYESGVSDRTLRRFRSRSKPPDGRLEKVSQPPPSPPQNSINPIPTHCKPKIGSPPKSPPAKASRILIFDIETLPNIGYFWDIFSDRAIPLDFIIHPKAICTIAYKWLGSEETNVLVVETPYADKDILEAFIREWEGADYAIAHYGDKFDKPFIAARLMANGLPPLPPVTTIDTYKLAKAHFGRTLNGNKLDHLGTILGVGNKIKTSADLWVRCANGDKGALAEMAAYNRQDVDLLEAVFKAMLPYVKSKLNLNLLTDEPILRCKACGSDHIEHRGYEYTAASMRHRYVCKECNSWSIFPKTKA